MYATAGVGGVLIWILLIPIGILVVIIHFIWTFADRIICWCEKGEKDDL